MGFALLSSKPVRTVLRWQLAATVAIALLAWPFAGADGALSAILGGLVNVGAGIVYFAMAGNGGGASALGTISRLIRAEASKIMTIVGALWLAFWLYKGIAFVPFFVAFAATALLTGAAFLARDEAASR